MKGYVSLFRTGVNEMVMVQARILDPTHLELAKPIAAGHERNIFVLITEQPHADAEKQQWMDASSESLQNAYGDTEPEYTPSMVREANPEHRA